MDQAIEKLQKEVLQKELQYNDDQYQRVLKEGEQYKIFDLKEMESVFKSDEERKVNRIL